MSKMKRSRKPIAYEIHSYEGGNGVLSLVMQLFLIFLSVVATVTCISTSLAMSISVVEVILYCLLTTLLFAVALYNKTTTLCFAGGAGALALILFGVLQDFFETLKSAVLFCYDLAFVLMKMDGWDYTENMITSEEHIQALLADQALVDGYFRTVVIVLAVFYAFWYVALAWKRPRVWPTILVSLAVMVPGFLIGLVPSFVSFTLLLASAFGLYMQTVPARHLDKRRFFERIKSLFKKQSRDNRFGYTMKSGLYGICITGVSFVFMLIVGLFTLRTPLIELEQVRTYLDEGSRYVYNQLFYSTLETPDSAIGNLLDSEEIDFRHIPKIHDVPVYYMTSSQNTDVYLRAWITDQYTDKGWKVINENDDRIYESMVDEKASPYNLAYRMQDVFESERLTADAETQMSYGFVTDTITLKARFSKSLMVHLPEYGGNKLQSPVTSADFIAGEVALFKKERPKDNTYTVSAFIPVVTSKGYVLALHGLSDKYTTLLKTDTSDIGKDTGTRVFLDFMEQERSYYNYVKQTYTSEGGITDNFKKLAKELSRDYKSQLARVLSIEKHFRNGDEFKYTLKPQKVLDAKPMEQLEYSLLTRKEGYCTYYATAMTLMVRSLGYPARLVNGYYVKNTDAEPNDKGDFERVVEDNDNHAWVEVYFPGIGWMNFDPTPDGEETQEEFDARYYALELEQQINEEQAMSGDTEDDDDSDSSEQSIFQDSFNAIDLEGQPDDNSETPVMVVDYGIFGGKKALLVLCGILAGIIVILLIILLIIIVRARIHAKKRYLSVYEADEDGNAPSLSLIGHRMYMLILRWLELGKIARQPGEDIKDFMIRVDQTLLTVGSFAALLPAIQRCEFGNSDIVDTQFQGLQLYYDEMYRLFHGGKKNLPWYKKRKV